MPELPSNEDGGQTEVADRGPSREEPGRRTPDESTVGLATSNLITGAPASAEAEAPGLEAGGRLADRFTLVRFIPAVFAVVAAAVLVLGGGYGLVKYRPSLRLREPERKTAFVVPRPKAGVLGIRNELGSDTPKWLPTAVTEVLAHELEAAESSLRLVATDWVDLEERSLGVSAKDLGDEKAQKRLQALLDADVFVYGTLSPAEGAPDGVRLQVQALDARTRRELGSFAEDLGAGGSRLVEALPALGAEVRKLLAVTLTAEEEPALASSRAHNLDAVEAYSTGVMFGRRWDIEEARSHFEAAAASDPSFLQAKRELARTWGYQSNGKKALEVWKSIRATQPVLTARQAALLDLRITPDRDKRNALFEAAPDDFELGLALADPLKPRPALQLMKRMKELRTLPPLILALREARAVGESADPQRAIELLDHVVTRATELDARWELAQARRFQADFAPADDPVRRKEALDRFQEAERLLAEVGELDDLATTKREKKGWLYSSGSRKEALAAADDAAAWYRRLGNRPWLAHMLLSTADGRREVGELAAARKQFDEARRELEALGESPDGFRFAYAYQVRARQDIDSANLVEAREGIRWARKTATIGAWPAEVERLEATVLYEQDQRAEARAAFSRVVALGGGPGFAACVVDCDGDNPAAGLECLARTCREGEATCELREAQCRLRASDLAGAERAARQAAAHFETAEDYEGVILSRAVLMRLAPTRSESAKAIRLLRADLAKLEAEGNKRLAFETTLALGDVELKAGRPEGRARLLKLEQEARSREFFRVARLAREALDRKPVAAVAPHR